MRDVEELLERLAALLEQVELLPEPARSAVFELLDGIDALHRTALGELGTALPDEDLAALRARHPALRWLFEAYGVGVEEREVVERVLAAIRPSLHRHGGDLTVLDVTGGVVRVELFGACAGCTASAATLRDGVDAALREGYPGYVGLDVVEATAPSHQPPGHLPLVQLQPRPVG